MNGTDESRGATPSPQSTWGENTKQENPPEERQQEPEKSKQEKGSLYKNLGCWDWIPTEALVVMMSYILLILVPQGHMIIYELLIDEKSQL